jgi:pimeloyl-ACP methyl ester carboxylesterase
MPIWGTSTYPPDKISHGYAKHAGKDTNVIWIYGTAPLFPWAELASAPTEEAFEEMARDSAERYRASVVDMRRLIDWAAMQPDIDASRIGFVGFSMSALVTATLLGNDPRIAAAVIMMGAANYGDIFATCHDKAGQVRDHAMQTFGWTLDQYRDFFRNLFAPADPMKYAGHYDPKKILMIDAMFDDCMPESSRAALWEVTGHPERITFLYRHRLSFYSLTPLGLNYSRRKIYRFLDEALEEKEGVETPR